MLYMFLLTFSIGFIMGTLKHIRNNKNLKLPKKNKASWNPGFLQDGVWGGIASLVSFLVASPVEIQRIILLSILSGYLGEAFIDNIASKMVKDDKYETINDTLSQLEKDVNKMMESVNEGELKNENNDEEWFTLIKWNHIIKIEERGRRRLKNEGQGCVNGSRVIRSTSFKQRNIE